jgi:hypothetical protein
MKPRLFVLGSVWSVGRTFITLPKEPPNSTITEASEKENVEKCVWNAKRTCKKKQAPRRITVGISWVLFSHNSDNLIFNIIITKMNKTIMAPT